ncbi:hypothetical protein BDM02DRAFT_3099578 [Thelephora ganbajun]|uniref:Uncharacterized protein n=1 Tax=Thelephora ganbajun TaxID=370292 RepID=A0ACB6ZAG0_THEGA|nr:hypothetical protein BDM02DRAFT_3099578 [Thelephora ganbajun]
MNHAHDFPPDRVVAELPPLDAHFYVPRLADRPQNPIMDTLKLLNDLKAPPVQSTLLTWREIADRAANQPLFDSFHIGDAENLWQRVCDKGLVHGTNLRSWDTWQLSQKLNTMHSPYISEQPFHVFIASRHFVRPQLSNAATEIIYVEQSELLASLRLTLMGATSNFHVWNPQQECFILRGLHHGKSGILSIIGRDEAVTQSCISRFLTIGTLSRRLEVLVGSLGQSASPTQHAFCHALDSLLAFARAKVMDHLGEDGDEAPSLSAIWAVCEDIADMLTACADVCERGVDRSPDQYSPIPDNIDLLSAIYQHCFRHFEGSSATLVNAAIAFILTLTSRHYLQTICSAIAYSGSLQPPDRESKRDQSYEEKHEDLEFSDVMTQGYPSFISKPLRDSLTSAQKSLMILQDASPDHPLLSKPAHSSPIEWYWTENEVETAWSGETLESVTSEPSAPTTPGCMDANEGGVKYKPELLGLQAYDLEPGSHGTNPSLLGPVRMFMDNFPERLPSVVPTINDLTNLVFGPLAEQASILSQAVLDIFLTPLTSLSPTPTVDLHIHSHLTVLRSYQLLASHSFKSKLSAALFSDSEDWTSGGQRSAWSLATRGNKRGTSGLVSDDKVWPVGLSASLLEKDSWPPGGTDLGFFLRTVVVDAMEMMRPRMTNPRVTTPSAYEESEWRIGFAIRDLPGGKGRDKWLDPSCAALDFLYMEYQPPRPLRVLVGPEVLSKYQRIFAFNLRLLRVENVVRMLHRLSRSHKKPLFGTLVKANTLFLHFRFLAHTFVAQLCSYIYDTAIRGHFDSFLLKLSTSKGHNGHRFSDVFELARHHSEVLDNILIACLLRSGQKAAGDALRMCLETVVGLGTLAGELSRGRVEEYQAKSTLEELYSVFKRRVSRLVR